VVEKFLKKYFLESKAVEGKVEISSFHQHPNELLSEALAASMGYSRKLPHMGSASQFSSTSSLMACGLIPSNS